MLFDDSSEIGYINVLGASGVTGNLLTFSTSGGWWSCRKWFY